MASPLLFHFALPVVPILPVLHMLTHLAARGLSGGHGSGRLLVAEVARRGGRRHCGGHRPPQLQCLIHLLQTLLTVHSPCAFVRCDAHAQLSSPGALQGAACAPQPPIRIEHHPARQRHSREGDGASMRHGGLQPSAVAACPQLDPQEDDVILPLHRHSQYPTVVASKVQDSAMPRRGVQIVCTIAAAARLQRRLGRQNRSFRSGLP
mmetsp:Transcript_8357/g.25039  ORF Transcript_8357/g.25039 Transcript_8357/m.25039 type:complete len:207 (+) Transcript_8357:4115-4735(+)